MMILAWSVALLCILAGICVLAFAAGRWRRVDEIEREYHKIFNQNNSK